MVNPLDSPIFASPVNELRKILLETQYIPPAEYFALMWRAESIYLEREEHYVKRSYRNRAYIAGANGRLRLSVPLKQGKNEQMPIDEVEIAYSDESWYSNHWNSIQSAYGKAPFFIYFADEVKSILFDKYRYLWDLNMAFIDFFHSKFDIPGNIEQTDQYLHKPEEIVDLREALHPRNENRIRIKLPEYRQIFQERHGFMHKLGALDLLFCTGPEAGYYLEGADIDLTDSSGLH